MHPVSVEIPDVTWSEFGKHFVWNQGEHVSCVGPTGSGKTTLMLEILERRTGLVCVYANKPRDETMEALVKHQGYKKVPSFKYSEHERKIVLWPKGKGMEDYELVQSKAYRQAMSHMWRQGYWTMVFDEVRYICDNLKLKKPVELFWQQGRATKTTILAGTQRPAFVPVMMFDQATHLFFWCDNDELNLKRLGGMGATDSKTVRNVIAQLKPRQVLYLNTRTGEMFTTVVEITKGKH